MLGITGTGGFKEYWREVIGLYDDLWFTSKTKNDSDLSRKRAHQQGKIGVDFASTFDGDNITFYYFIQAMPEELNLSFKKLLRAECKRGVRVNFINYMRRHRIDWNSAQMKSRLRILREVSEDNDSKKVTAYNLNEHISTIGKQGWIERSLQYLSIADIQRGRALMKSTVMMTISGTRGEDFDESVVNIEAQANAMQIKLQRILYDIPDMVGYMSPFKRSQDGKIVDSIPVQVMPDELLARYNTYSQGTLGLGGITFGTDVHSKFPVLKVVKPKDDTAENWLITAETGGGKSFLIKTIILQLLGLGYNGTIMDIEGFEYIPLANYVSHNSKVVIINMAEGSGNYFDPLEIFETTGIEEVDRDAKTMSSNFTLSLFKTLLGKAYHEDVWLDTVVSDIVSQTYARKGVTDDPLTWYKSKGLTVRDCFATLESLIYEKYRVNTEYLNACDKAYAILSKYFKEDGIRNAMFKNRVQVSDIIDADLVVCSFGMAGKSENSVDATQMALMQLGAAHISHQRSIFSKVQGKFNFKLWEEFQRWGKFPDSEKTIGVAVTGGRKLGDVNMIITNELGTLLKDDKLDIISNITSYLVGSIKDQAVREMFCKARSIPNMLPELDMIAKHAVYIDKEEKASITVDDKYTYSFLCGLDNNKFGIVKAEIPSELAQSKLLKTGVDLSGNIDKDTKKKRV